MKQYFIMVDAMDYFGESEATYEKNYGGSGWHVSNHRVANHLLFEKPCGNKPKLIEGEINLKSHLEKIFRYIHDGHLKGDIITIYAAGHELSKITGKLVEQSSNPLQFTETIVWNKYPQVKPDKPPYEGVYVEHLVRKSFGRTDKCLWGHAGWFMDIGDKFELIPVSDEDVILWCKMPKGMQP